MPTSLKTDPLGRAHTFCHAVTGKWHTMGVTLSAGGSLQWYKNALGEPEITVAKKAGSDVYDLLIQKASVVPPGCDGVCFLPYLTGERTPHADPLATGAFIGLTPRCTKGHLTRAVIEGVCYSLRDCIEIFREMNVPLTRGRITGGGTKNPFWRHALADILGQPMCTLEAGEGAAFGVALLAAVGTGTFKSVEEACDATVKTTTATEPNPDAVKVYNRYYPAWRELYGSLKESYQRLANV